MSWVRLFNWVISDGNKSADAGLGNVDVSRCLRGRLDDVISYF